MSIFSHGKLVTVLQYFTDRVDDYWHILYPLIDPKNREADPFLYFYDISRKATDFSGPFSDDGIYLFKGYDGSWHLHALEISQYTLACWLAWRKTADDIWLQRAMHHCDWLLSHQDEDGGWRIKHKNPIYSDLPDHWPSALAQGLAISALIRAYRCRKELRYLDAAKKAALFLEKRCEDGGVKRMFSRESIDGFLYEEYPRRHLSGVLNGYISAIFGLSELSELDEEFSVVLHSNLENLLRILPLYDSGFWSFYALDGNLDSGFYHRLVTKQLCILGEEDERFLPFAERFERYTRCKRCALRALAGKIFGKIS
ncbi:D-glucuronyl C5-epimerase family protein [Hydrogenimonas sp.]